MGLKAVFSAVTDNTQMRLKGTPPSQWIPSDVGDPLHDWDESRNDDPPQPEYKVTLASKSEINFDGATVNVDLRRIIGPVAYLPAGGGDNWQDCTGKPDQEGVAARAVDTGVDGSVGVRVTDGSRGVFRPPQWPGAQ